MKEEQNNKTFSVKVPTWAYQLINIIAESREHGSNGNDLLKKCLMFVIESAKIDGPVPVEFKTLLNMLKLDTAWHNAFNFADAGATMDIAQIVLILQQRNEDGTPRKGFGLCMIDKPFMPNATPTMTLCVDEILEKVTEVSMPGLYNLLRKVGLKINSLSVRETLTTMCDAQLVDSLDEEFSGELPQMGNYSDFGRAIEYANRKKTKQHRTIDGEAARQQRIQWNENDKQTAEAEVQDWEGEFRQTEFDPGEEIVKAIGCKPFDVEP